MSFTVYIDADNTLYNTTKVFARAQLGMLERAEAQAGTTAGVAEDKRLSYVREVSEHIAELDHRDLKYPPSYLHRALVYRLSGATAENAAKLAHRENELEHDPDGHAAWFWSQINTSIPELRSGVREGLDALLAENATLVVLTESPQDRCEKILKHHNLLDKFGGGVVEARKTPELYKSLKKLNGNKHTPVYMVGDQLDRDIGFAKQAGFITIHFPGGFNPKWQPGNDTVTPCHTITSFDEVAAIYRKPANENKATFNRHGARKGKNSGANGDKDGGKPNRKSGKWQRKPGLCG